MAERPNSAGGGIDGAASAIDWVGRVRAVAPLIAARLGEIERRRELPAGVREALVECGLFRLLLPRSLGGAELMPAEFVPVIEEIAKIDASTAWCLNQTAGCSMTAAYLEPAAAREIFGPKDGILAWGPGPGTARATKGGYRVTADFSFASGSHDANWLGAHLPVVEEDGTPRRGGDAGPVVRTLLFPKSAARMTDIWHVIGLRGTGSDRYSVADLFVPEAFCIARHDEARPRETGLLYRFSNLQLFSAGFAGVALGIARAMLDAFMLLARNEVPRGEGRILSKNQVIQAQVAECEARLSAARAFLFDALDAATDASRRHPRLPLEARMTIRLAASFAIHEARDAAGILYHAAGATAIFAGSPFERRFRDIHAVAQQLQGRQEHFEAVGQYLLGLEPDGLMWL
jgi:alkylation response protein AidB-like acyl-CoA dehydrogenase